jgi:spermidine/putrescine transport system permease protein
MARRRREGSRAPWLRAITIVYLVWSLAPILIAILFSFNAAPSNSRWEGFSLRWWVGDPEAQSSIVYDPELRVSLLHSLTLAFWTTMIAVPLGTACALGLHGWRTRTSRVVLTALLVLLALPPIALAQPLYLLFIEPLRTVPFGELGWFGTPGQLGGLVTMFLPLATLITFGRLMMLDRQHELAATDLGSPPSQVVTRVILPQIGPAIGATVAVVFAGAMGEFVVVDALVGGNDTRAFSTGLFGAIGGAEPTTSVIGTVLAVTGGIACACVVLAFRSSVGLVSRRRLA